MSRALITINGERDRALGAKWIAKAELGTRIEFKATKRSLPQNDRMWAMLTDIAMQLPWHGHKLRPDDWKILFLDALNREVYAVPDLYGIGRVNLGRSSSDLSKDEMAQLMELMAAFGTEHNVKFRDQPEPDAIGKAKPDRAEILRKAREAKAIKRNAPQSATEATLAEELKEEDGRLQRRIVHATRPKRPLTLDEAIGLHKATEAPTAVPVAEASIPAPLEKVIQQASQAQDEGPRNREEYVDYAREMIGVAPSPENWFLSEAQAKLRQVCKVDDLTVQLLLSVAKGK